MASQFDPLWIRRALHTRPLMICVCIRMMICTLMRKTFNWLHVQECSANLSRRGVDCKYFTERSSFQQLSSNIFQPIYDICDCYYFYCSQDISQPESTFHHLRAGRVQTQVISTTLLACLQIIRSLSDGAILLFSCLLEPFEASLVSTDRLCS